MNTQTLRAAFSAYNIAKIGLLAGTGFEAFTQWQALFGHWMPTVFFTGLTCLLFDRTAFKFLESFAGHASGQTKLPTNFAVVVTFIVGIAAFVGTMGFSLMAVPIIADAATADKSDTYKDLANVKSDADKSKAALLAEATAEIHRAETALQRTKEESAKATANAIRREGGSFAKLMQEGNTWVRSAPQFRPQRERVRKAQANADAAVTRADAALQSAIAAKQNLLTAKDDNAAQVMAAGMATVNTWQERRKNMRAVTLYLTIGAGIVALLSLSVLAAFKKLPETKDITDVIGEAYDNLLQFVVFVADATNRAFVAQVLHRLQPQIEQPEPQQAKPESDVRKLQKKIREYKRRAEAGTLGSKGMGTLRQLEWEINSIS
jgi:hypothetical protein